MATITPSRLILAAATSMALAQGAMAQSMDYGSLQDLFGEPVTTSATGKPQRASEVPAAMSIITADEITKSGARSLPDVLNRVVGIDVQQWSSTSTDVGVRGYNQGGNPKLLVLLNGRQVYQDYYGFTLWSSIPVQLSEIRQIEVVKGPQSALFGFNAVSGVINIVTYNPLYDNAGAADITFGTQNFREINAFKTLKFGNWGGVRVAAGGWTVDPFGSSRTPLLNRFYDKDGQRRTASLDSLFQVNPDTQVGFETTWGHHSEFSINPAGGASKTSYKIYSLKGNIKANTGIGLLEGSVYRSNLKTRPHTVTSSSNIESDTTIAQVQDLVKLTDTLTSRIAGEFRENSIESWPVRGITTGYKNYALATMFDWQASANISLTAAARWDHTTLLHKGAHPYPFTEADYDRSFDSFSYNGGIVWRVTPQDSLLISTGRGVGAPNLIELSNRSVPKPAAGQFIISGNPNVDPSITTSYEIGWRHTIDGINGFGRLAVSHQETKDLRFINIGSVKLINGYPTFLLGDNLGSSKAWNLEAELQGRMDMFRWNLSWMWMDTNDDIKIAAVLISQNYEKSNARNTLKANLGWDSGPWNTELSLRWQSKTYRYFNDGSGTKLFEIKPGLMAQASVGYQVTPDLRLSLSGADLLRSETQLSPAPKAERRVWATASYKL
ncbi:TonB-dependent receptor [Niveispirillum sp. BGYR6]|uniref:TonB-dependent receptor plug domain-containing protein n=1 Tax=Niveispirillum sp. BGYR6 TaxID=2971249 RepID=UPI0022B95D42|nr:TonB-dependent receptor [Niveispirillum sp. BGYR6]MDG5495529.1 TonB-dependent receptor [Niveispirillum sp. BGYR6]